MMADEGAGPQPTTKDAHFFLTILCNMKNKPDVDWDVVAEKAGYNSVNTAKVRFGQIKRKLGYTDNSGDGSSPSGAKIAKPRTPAKPRAKKDNPSPGSGTNGSPMKVEKMKRALPAKKETQAKFEVESDDEVVDMEEMKLMPSPIKEDPSEEEEDIEYYETGGDHE